MEEKFQTKLCDVIPVTGVMEADDRQVTTVFTVNRHSTIGTRQTEYHEALPSSANDEVRCDDTFADDGNADLLNPLYS